MQVTRDFARRVAGAPAIAPCRRSKIRFMVLPDMLKNAPMFKQIGEDAHGRGRGVGYGVRRGGKPYVNKK